MAHDLLSEWLCSEAGALAELLAQRALTWRAHAACLGTDIEVWFAADTAPALAVCAQCPVIAECREFAEGQRVADGVWGGLSPAQRRAESAMVVEVGGERIEVRRGVRYG